jgi:hypothetical protein
MIKDIAHHLDINDSSVLKTSEVLECTYKTQVRNSNLVEYLAGVIGSKQNEDKALKVLEHVICGQAELQRLSA